MFMRSFLFILFLLTGIHQSISQTTEIIIKAGENTDVLNSHVYRYPQFVQGKVYYNDGTIAAGNMNLNFFSGAMQFINVKGDTLAMDENNIRFVAVEKDTFYFNDENYFERVENYSAGKLLSFQILKLADEKSTGAYGISTSTHRIDNYNTLRAYAQYTLQLNRNLVFTKEKHYYFRYGSGTFLLANRKNVLKAFSNKKTEVENYIIQNNVDISQEDDLKKLFAQFLK